MIEQVTNNIPLSHLLALLLVPASTALALLGWVLFAVKRGDVQHMVVQAMGMKIEFTLDKERKRDNTNLSSATDPG